MGNTMTTEQAEMAKALPGRFQNNKYTDVAIYFVRNAKGGQQDVCYAHAVLLRNVSSRFRQMLEKTTKSKDNHYTIQLDYDANPSLPQPNKVIALVGSLYNPQRLFVTQSPGHLMNTIQSLAATAAFFGCTKEYFEMLWAVTLTWARRSSQESDRAAFDDAVCCAGCLWRACGRTFDGTDLCVPFVREVVRLSTGLYDACCWQHNADDEQMVERFVMLRALVKHRKGRCKQPEQ